MQKKPLISVIVPVYNVEKYLPKCLDSLLAQTWQELEIIVVDDGSPDNSWDIMQEYARRDSRIRPIRQKNGGLSAARNAGVEAARGEWIGFLDSDDYVAPEMYERLYRAAAEQGAQMAVCSFTYVTPDGKPIPRTSPITKNEVLSGIQMMERLAGPQNWYYITAWNRLYQKKLFDAVRFPVGKLHEDEYTAHLFYWQCERVGHCKRGNVLLRPAGRQHHAHGACPEAGGRRCGNAGAGRFCAGTRGVQSRVRLLQRRTGPHRFCKERHA